MTDAAFVAPLASFLAGVLAAVRVTPAAPGAAARARTGPPQRLIATARSSSGAGGRTGVAASHDARCGISQGRRAPACGHLALLRAARCSARAAELAPAAKLIQQLSQRCRALLYRVRWRECQPLQVGVLHVIA